MKRLLTWLTAVALVLAPAAEASAQAFGVRRPAVAAATAASQQRAVPPKVPFAPRKTNPIALNGSSSSAGTTDGSRNTMISALQAATPGSTQAILVSSGNSASPWKSEAAGGATTTTVTTQVSTSVSAGNAAATRIVQVDLNDVNSSADIGAPETHADWLRDSIVPLLDASVVSQGRLLVWNGTENGWGNNMWRMFRLHRFVWADHPGRAVLSLRYWWTAPQAGPGDNAAINAGEIPRSYQMPDRSHPNGHRGDVYMARSWMIPFASSVEGGLPFFPNHRYFFNASTAQTNGGNVGQLYYSGSLTGVTLQLLDLAGRPSADFAISNSAYVTRRSATVLKAGYYDLLVRSCRGVECRTDRIALGIGSVNLCNCDEMTLDGNTWATLESVDNAGTVAAPSYTTSSRTFGSGFGTGHTKFSFVARLEAAAGYDGQTMNILWSGSSRGVAITKNSLDRIDVLVRDEGGTSLGSVTATGSTCAAGNLKAGCGKIWVLYSANVGRGGTNLNRQRLMIVRDSDGLVLYDSGSLKSATLDARSTVNLNPVNGSFAFFSGSLAGPVPGQGLSSQTFAGKVARMLMFNKEIDWTSGCTSSGDSSIAGATCSNGDNLKLFRSGAGTLTDLGSASTNITGDGRTVTLTGAGAYDTGSAAPYFGLSGNAGDFHQGLSIGTASGLGGEEPGNAALVGGVTFETWDRREYRDPNNPQGIAFTSWLLLLAARRRRPANDDLETVHARAA